MTGRKKYRPGSLEVPSYWYEHSSYLIFPKGRRRVDNSALKASSAGKFLVLGCAAECHPDFISPWREGAARIGLIR